MTPSVSAAVASTEPAQPTGAAAPSRDAFGTMQLRGVRVHNLRGIDLDLPLGKLIVVSGVSGSGKSSLAFDTLFREGQRRYIESFSTAGRRFLDRIERPDADSLSGIPAAVAIRQRRTGANARATVATLAEIDDYLRLLWARCGDLVCPGCGQPVVASTVADATRSITAWPAGRKFQITIPIAAQAESPSAPGRSPSRAETRIDDWKRRGYQRVIVGDEQFDLRDVSADFVSRCLANDAETLVVVDRLSTGTATAERIAEAVEIAYTEGQGRAVVLVERDDDQPLDSPATSSKTRTIGGRRWMLHRFSEQRECFACQRTFAAPEPALLSFHSPAGRCALCQGTGVVRQGKRTNPIPGTERICPACAGRRWNDDALAVRWHGASLADLSNRSVSAARRWLAERLPADPIRSETTEKAAESSRQAVERTTGPELDVRLELLERVGLGYLELGRAAQSLSAGELQRVRLTAALGCRLVETLYVLDEPTAGLHPRDRTQLLGALRELRDLGNTLVVVEHDEELIAAADWVVLLGPGAGGDGGRVVASGPPDALVWNKTEPGSLALSEPRRLAHPDPARAPRPSGWIDLRGVTHRNLRGIDVRFPTGLLTAVTGVSGAGKSSLVIETLYPALAARTGSPRGPAGAHTSLDFAGPVSQVLFVDGLPPARGGRGNIATYLGVHDAVRRLLAESAEAKARGLGPGAFSFNLADGGRCPACEGEGTQTVDLVFLPDVAVPCPECGGTRFRKEVLDITYRGHNVAQILDLTVREAFPFFRGQVRLQRKLKLLRDVGLDYLTLGQPLSTVSGGEAQRLKLTRELSQGTRDQTLFLFEEPTVGLHATDIATLIACFRQLVAAGHSVLVIEHHPRLIAAADYVIDLGPGAGDEGGQIVYTGPVAGLLSIAGSATGRCLADWLSRSGVSGGL